MRKLLAALLILSPAVAWGQANPWGTRIAPAQSGTTYTVQPTDCSLTIPFTSSSPVTVTLPAAGVVGCEVWLLQSGTGTVTAVNGSGATIPNPYPTTATVAQNSTTYFNVTANAGGSAAAWTMKASSAYGGSGSTTITLAPGLTSTPGTANPGTQTVTNGSTISPQFNPVPKTANYAISTTSPYPDTGNLLQANGSGSITFTLPNPGAAGGASGLSYAFGDLSGHGYSLATTSGTANFQGTAAPATTLSVGSGTFGGLSCTSDGTAWNCIEGTPPGSAGSVSLSTPQSWTAGQRGTPSVLTISTSTFTPSFDAANNFSATLIHASCPCTIANPSTTPVAGQSGMIAIAQSSTGSDTIGTWGSQYKFASGTTPTLSTGANAVDFLPYYVFSATQIVVGAGVLNAH
jgi:hypothetical protein